MRTTFIGPNDPFEQLGAVRWQFVVDLLIDHSGPTQPARTGHVTLPRATSSNSTRCRTPFGQSHGTTGVAPGFAKYIDEEIRASV
jgi:hypothetical protein